MDVGEVSGVFLFTGDLFKCLGKILPILASLFGQPDKLSKNKKIMVKFLVKNNTLDLKIQPTNGLDFLSILVRK